MCKPTTHTIGKRGRDSPTCKEREIIGQKIPQFSRALWEEVPYPELSTWGRMEGIIKTESEEENQRAYEGVRPVHTTKQFTARGDPFLLFFAPF